jgi:hypothetical protein
VRDAYQQQADGANTNAHHKRWSREPYMLVLYSYRDMYPCTYTNVVPWGVVIACVVAAFNVQLFSVFVPYLYSVQLHLHTRRDLVRYKVRTVIKQFRQ